MLVNRTRRIICFCGVIITTCTMLYPLAIYAADPAPSDKFTSEFTSNKGGDNFQLIKYDPEVYKLAYQIFLQNHNIQDAFAVAYAAAKQQPADLQWHQRLITVSIWNAQPVIALDEYEYLAKNYHDQAALTTGTTLAQKIHEDTSLSHFLALDIQHGVNNQALWREYIDTLIRIGELQLAINQLIAHRQHLAPEFYFPQIIELSGYLAQIHFQQEALNQYTAIFGITPYSALKQTAIDLTTGNVRHAFKQLHSAHAQALNNDFNFWQIYAQMAWLNNHDFATLYAYRKLLRQPPKPKEEVFERLVSLHINANPTQAYYYAQLGRDFYPRSLILTQNILSLAVLLGRWDDITRLMPVIPAKVKQQLNNDPDFWLLMGEYWGQRSSTGQTIRHYQIAIQRFPENDALKADYMTFLFQNNQLFLLSPLLTQPPKNICLAPELWGAYTTGYAHNHNYAMRQAIVQLYSRQFIHYQHDPYWLIGFKDFLEQSLLFTQADAVSHYAWPLYLQLLSKQKQPVDYEQLIDYAKLSVDEAPGDPTAKVMALLQKHLTPDSAELMLSWALSQKNYPLADAIYNYYLLIGWKPPASLVLTLALYHKDGYLTRDLLIAHASALPAEDRIQGAMDIGALPLAQDLAYEGLAEQPHNADIYENYFTPLMLKSADNIDFRQQYYQFGPEEGPRTKLDITYALTPSIIFTPYASTWFLHDTSTADLATVPPHDDRAGLKTRIVQPHGDLLIDLGYRDNLNDFFTAKLMKNYMITHNLSAVFSAGYNQPADDTAALLIGGVKQELVGNLNYDLTATDSLQGEYAQNFFYTQDGQFLADGQQQTLRYKHQFWQQYPDWSIGAYGTSAQYYNKTGMLTGNALTLVPIGTVPDATFFIPSSFVEYGITAEFGQNFHEDYTHSWKPFGAFTVMNSSTAGFGRLFDVGIGGAVFGRDHLAIYFEQGVNQAVGVNKSRLIELMYQFYL